MLLRDTNTWKNETVRRGVSKQKTLIMSRNNDAVVRLHIGILAIREVILRGLLGSTSLALGSNFNIAIKVVVVIDVVRSPLLATALALGSKHIVLGIRTFASSLLLGRSRFLRFGSSFRLRSSRCFLRFGHDVCLGSFRFGSLCWFILRDRFILRCYRFIVAISCKIETKG